MTKEFEDLVARCTAAVQAEEQSGLPRIAVGVSGCSEAVGARETLRTIRAELAERGLEALTEEVGCRGVCYAEPLVDVQRPGSLRITYGPVTPDIVPEFVERVIVQRDPWPELALFVNGSEGYAGIPSENDFDFYRLQTRHLLVNCGYSDPISLEHYVARGGLAALHKALTQMSPDDVINEVKASGLTGRGGAAFPTGRKWESARASKNHPKYLIDNGEEGEPFIYKDRRLLEGDPYRVLEGVLINAYAIDADKVYLYIGGEHKVAIARTEEILKRARAAGLIGKNVLGTSFSVEVEVRVGAGSYAAGESSAMMSSIEGRRAMPRPKLVRSTERGVWAQPTCMNNTETHANIPLIIERGGAWYAQTGTEKSKGTKIFAVSGHIKRPGMIEVPMGMTLKTMLHDVCGGMSHDRPFKAAQPGGVSSAPIPASKIDVQMAIETLEEIGALLGSGGITFFDDSVCMVDMNNYLVNFNELESCSRCITCRVGTMRLTDILTRMCNGEGRPGDLEALAWLGPLMEHTTLCGLGQAAPVPAVGALNIFRDEFEAHIHDKRCPAGFCEALTKGAAVPVAPV